MRGAAAHLGRGQGGGGGSSLDPVHPHTKSPTHNHISYQAHTTQHTGYDTDSQNFTLGH